MDSSNSWKATDSRDTKLTRFVLPSVLLITDRLKLNTKQCYHRKNATYDIRASFNNNDIQSNLQLSHTSKAFDNDAVATLFICLLECNVQHVQYWYICICPFPGSPDWRSEFELFSMVGWFVCMHVHKRNYAGIPDSVPLWYLHRIV